MSDRHICPACGTEGQTITISDTSYICGVDDCGVHWNPQLDDPDPYYPVRYAIGFCPRCKTDAGDPGHEYDPTYFECPECGYEWYDSRLDGKTLSLREGYAERVNDFPSDPRRYALYQ